MKVKIVTCLSFIVLFLNVQIVCANGKESWLNTRLGLYLRPVFNCLVTNNKVISALTSRGESNVNIGHDILGDKTVIEFTPNWERPFSDAAIVYFPGLWGDVRDTDTDSILTETTTKLGIPAFQLSYPWHTNKSRHPNHTVDYVCNQAEQLITALKCKGYKTIIPMGFSYGATLALQVARDEQAPFVCLTAPFKTIDQALNKLLGKLLKSAVPSHFEYDSADDIPRALLDNAQTLSQIHSPMKIYLTYGATDGVVGKALTDHVKSVDYPALSLKLYKNERFGFHDNMSIKSQALQDFIKQVQQFLDAK